MPLKQRSAISNIVIALLTFAIGTQCTVVAQTPRPKTSRAVVTVPFIGCQADGQAGPLDAPKGATKAVKIPAEAAQRLAYYKAEQGPGVLAPRGWYCFATYGSNGGSLFVSQYPIDAATLFSDTWKGFTGPVLQVSGEAGDTSGRFGVARTIARVFPSHEAFVHKVIAEGLVSASLFQFGPYPKDKVIYKNKETVEYQTPAQTDGLGTQSRLQKNADPIRGVAILVGSTPDLVFLAARLPSDMNDLTPLIIQQTESDATQPEN